MDNEPLLRDLQLFCAIARKSSFAAAATEFGTSPTYVSRRIGLLEEKLGVRLFNRTTRRVGITDDGETVYRWAQRILENFQDMKDEVARVRGEPRGPLRISTSLKLGRNHVAPILSLLMKDYPDLEIWLELLDRRVDLIEEGFHLDIRVGEIHEPNLIAHKIAASWRIICAAPSYLARRGRPTTLAEAAKHNCLAFRDRGESFGLWRLHGPGGPETVNVTGSMASNQSDIVHGWAVDGHGLVMASQWDVAEQLKSGALVQVLPEWRQPADVWAVTTSRLSHSAKVRVCVEFLKQYLSSGPFALIVKTAPADGV